MLKAGSYSSLSQQASKVWHSKEDVLFGYQKDILFGGNGADILAALTDKGQNRLYGGGDRDILFAGVNDRLFGEKGDDILFAGRVTTP